MRLRVLKLVLISSLVLAMCPVIHAAGQGATPNGKPFVTLQGQIVEVQGKLSSIQEQVDAIVRQVATIEERVTADGEAIAKLQMQNTELGAQISAYGTTQEALQARVNELQAQNTALAAQLVANSATDANLQAQIDYNSGLISQLQQAIGGISTLQDQISNNTALITALQQEIGSINERLAMKQNIVNGTCPAGEAVRQINQDGSVACQVLGAGVGSVTTYRIYNYRRLAPNTKGSIELLCNSGDLVTGGGFVGGWGYSGMLVYESAPGYLGLYPNGNDFWKVSAKNNGVLADDLIARAICMTVQMQ